MTRALGRIALLLGAATLPALVVAGVLSAPTQQPAACYPAQLVRIVDGDTIDVALQVRAETAPLGISCLTELKTRVRLASVRVPEPFGPDAETAAQARAWLESRLQEALAASRAEHCWHAACPEALEVCPRLDRKGLAVRSLGRLVADVRAGGRDMGAELVAAGLARPGTKEGW